jgi:poly(3-hydroxybutyrate) depolymerase
MAGINYLPKSLPLWCAGVATLLLAAGHSRAAGWPPALDTGNPVTRCNGGRLVERYTHGSRDAWGYPAATGSEWEYSSPRETGAAQQNHNSFYVVAPQTPRENAPLYVVLHSANRTAYDYFGFACLDRKIDGGDDPATAMTNAPDDFYILFLNSTNAEWWGWTQTRQNSARKINTPPPAELRVLDTIEWAVTRYKIDRNRIYLSGVSMGGNGTLGIGMPHGDIFAAIRATVPAGTGYAAYRMGGIAPSPAVDAPQPERDAWIQRASAASLPDPPVIVDFSSQQDTWAMTQPALVQAAQAGRLPLVLGWAAFGHATFASLIAKYPLCQIALAFPWLEIRKNEAYPVFTRSSSDQRSPWLNAPADFDSAGQSNAYFRWKNQEDTPSTFTIQLWIAHPTVKDPPLSMPDTATADITIRRFQRFRIESGRRYTWQVLRASLVIAAGTGVPDAAGLLTIPAVTLTTVPIALTLRPGRR